MAIFFYFLIATDTLKVDKLSDDRVPNKYIDVGFDAVVFIILMVAGFYFLSLIYTLGTLVQFYLRDIKSGISPADQAN